MAKKPAETKKKDQFSNYRDLLVIDKNALDDELIQQPMRFFEISDLHTAAIATRDKAKEELMLKDAILQAKHRRQLEDAGERPTIQAIEERVIADPTHVKFRDAYIDAKTHADECYAMKESFQQRSYMLRELVALYIAGYYATSAMTNPKRKGAGESAYEANKKRISETRKSKLRRK